MSNAASPRRDGIMHKLPGSVQLLPAQRIIHPTRTLRCCLFRNGFKVAKFECGRRRTYTSITTKSDPPAPSGRLVGGKDRCFFPKCGPYFRIMFLLLFFMSFASLRRRNLPAASRQERNGRAFPEKSAGVFGKSGRAFWEKTQRFFQLIPERMLVGAGVFPYFCPRISASIYVRGSPVD